MSELTPLTDEALNTLRGDFAQSGTNRLAMNAVTAGIDKVARNYDRARLMQRRFSTIVDNGEATHQDRSGRCWLFSSLNVARGRRRPVDHGHERVQEVRRCAQGPVPGDRILQEHR